MKIQDLKTFEFLGCYIYEDPKIVGVYKDKDMKDGFYYTQEEFAETNAKKFIRDLLHLGKTLGVID